MKRIMPSQNKHHWPRQAVKTIECRKRDLVVRVANWMSDRDEPAYDVEVYIGGVYDWNESQSFTIFSLKTEAACKAAAIEYAAKQIAKLL